MAYAYPPPAVQHIGRNFTKTIHNDTYPAIEPSTKSNLSGKSVFISGASKGIGRATALSYAKAGVSHIALGARSDFSSLESEILAAAKAAGKPAPNVLTLKLDVQDLSSVQNAAKATEEAFGRLDILINNAGYLEKFGLILESDMDEVWKTWEINYRGVWWMTRAFLPLLIKSTDGFQTIVNLSSVGAHVVTPGGSGYQSSKNAIIRFTEHICADYASKGILAYAVHPGGVMTELASNMPKHMYGLLTDTPEMAADTMVFLTQEKRTWLAGRYVSVAWDMPEFLVMKDEIVKGDKLKTRMVV